MTAKREVGKAAAVQLRALRALEKLYGENSHHIAEACFKGLARALRGAIAVDARQGGRVPSTKGTL